CRAEYY
ncbi:Fatty acid metabolism regulator protein, partial [Haemophilus influenzae]